MVATYDFRLTQKINENFVRDHQIIIHVNQVFSVWICFIHSTIGFYVKTVPGYILDSDWQIKTNFVQANERSIPTM